MPRMDYWTGPKGEGCLKSMLMFLDRALHDLTGMNNDYKDTQTDFEEMRKNDKKRC